MKNNKVKSIYIAWAVLYAICAGVSFIPEPAGALRGFMVVLALAFFVCPALLLYFAVKRQQWNAVRLVRGLCLASLSLTMITLVLTFLSAGANGAKEIGMILQVILILVSVPMICGNAWVLSLFLWAVLLMVCLKYRKECRKKAVVNKKYTGKRKN